MRLPSYKKLLQVSKDTVRSDVEQQLYRIVKLYAATGHLLSTCAGGINNIGIEHQYNNVSTLADTVGELKVYSFECLLWVSWSLQMSQLSHLRKFQSCNGITNNCRCCLRRRLILKLIQMWHFLTLIKLLRGCARRITTCTIWETPVRVLIFFWYSLLWCNHTDRDRHR